MPSATEVSTPKVGVYLTEGILAPHGEDTIASRPHRSASVSMQANLLYQIQAATSESEPGDGLSDENNEEQMESDDLDYMAGHQGPNSDSDVDIGEIQLSSTGQLSILAPKPSSTKGSARSRGRPKKTNVRMTQEESKSGDDIPGESNLVLLIIHMFIVYTQHLSTSFMRSMIAIEDLDVT